MKKAIIALVLLVGLLATASADVAFGGDVTFGAIFDLTDETTATTITATVDVKATVDDYNYVQVSAKRNADTIEPLGVEYAYIKTDLGKFFLADSGVGILTYAGWLDMSDNSYSNTSQYANENMGNAQVKGWAFGTEIDLMGFATIRAFTQPTVDNDLWFGIRTAQTMGAASFAAEVVFDGASQAELADGNLIVDGEFKIAFGDIKLDVGAGMRYQMAGDGTLLWGAGLGVDYGTLFGVAAGIDANADGLNLLTADITLDPIDLLDVRAAAKFSLAEATPSEQMFQGADVCIILNIGKVDIYAGYLIAGDGVSKGNTWAPASVANGGPYVKFDIDY